jgi:hypothetical protein
MREGPEPLRIGPPAESRAYGWGGVRAVSSVIGIRKGLAELARRDEDPHTPVRAARRASKPTRS